MIDVEVSSVRANGVSFDYSLWVVIHCSVRSLGAKLTTLPGHDWGAHAV